MVYTPDEDDRDLDLLEVGRATTDWQARIDAARAKARAGDADAPESDARPDPHGTVVTDEGRAAAERWMARIPARFHTAHVDQLDGAVRELADDWMAEGMTTNVLLLGNVGVGKTHAAVAMARAAHDEGCDVSFWPVVELLDAIRPNGDPHALDRAINADVLVLDDLGAERPTDWTWERLFLVVNRRYLEMRPTLATSNLPIGGDGVTFTDAVGERIYSRLYEGAARLKMGGDDRRRQEGAA